jgi:hypothetical protein
MKYVLEIHHWLPASLSTGHDKDDLQRTIKAPTLWALLRKARRAGYEAEFWRAVKRKWAIR